MLSMQNDDTAVYDAAKGTNRIKETFDGLRTTDFSNEFLNARKVVTKEVESDGTAHYKFFDLISLRDQSFPIEKEIYIVAGEKSVKVVADYFSSDRIYNINENTDTILASDSSEVEIVTGYDQVRKREIKMSYEIDASLAKSMAEADEVLFRYYAGPEIMTFVFRNNRLRRLREVLKFKS